MSRRESRSTTAAKATTGGQERSRRTSSKSKNATAAGAAPPSPLARSSSRSRPSVQRMTSLDVLHHGVPEQYRRAPSMRGTGAATGASASSSAVPAAAPVDLVPFSDYDLNYAAKAAAEHAYLLWTDRESDWNLNRTAELDPSHAGLDQSRWLDLLHPAPLPQSPAVLMHALPEEERRAWIAAAAEEVKQRAKEREEEERARLEGRVRDKLRRAEEEARKKERAARAAAGIEEVMTPRRHAEILSSLPSDAPACSHVEWGMQRSACPLLTLDQYVAVVPLHPSSLTARHIELQVRNRTNYTLCVALSSNAPLYAFFRSPLFFLAPNASGCIALDYVGAFENECAALPPDVVFDEKNRSAAYPSPHSLRVSLRAVSRRAATSGVLAFHPSHYLERAAADPTEGPLHEFTLPIQWARGNEKTNNLHSIDDAAYRQWREKSHFAALASPLPSRMRFSTPLANELPSASPLSSHDSAGRSRRKRQRAKTMASLRPSEQLALALASANGDSANANSANSRSAFDAELACATAAAKYRSMEERAVAAEERASAAEQRLASLESGAAEAEKRAKEAEDRAMRGEKAMEQAHRNAIERIQAVQQDADKRVQGIQVEADQRVQAAQAEADERMRANDARVEERKAQALAEVEQQMQVREAELAARQTAAEADAAARIAAAEARAEEAQAEASAARAHAAKSAKAKAATDARLASESRARASAEEQVQSLSEQLQALSAQLDALKLKSSYFMNDRAAEEAKYSAHDEPQFLVSNEPRSLFTLLGEWEEAITAAEQRRNDEAERLQSLRAHAPAGSRLDGSAAVTFPPASPPSPPPVGADPTPLSRALLQSQRSYLLAELSALDYERDSLNSLEVDIVNQAHQQGRRLNEQNSAVMAATYQAGSPHEERRIERRYARLRERLLQVEAQRAHHRQLLLSELDRLRKTRVLMVGGTATPSGGGTSQAAWASPQHSLSPVGSPSGASRLVSPSRTSTSRKTTSQGSSGSSSSKCNKSPTSMARLAKIYGVGGVSEPPHPFAVLPYRVPDAKPRVRPARSPPPAMRRAASQRLISAGAQVVASSPTGSVSLHSSASHPTLPSNADAHSDAASYPSLSYSSPHSHTAHTLTHAEQQYAVANEEAESAYGGAQPFDAGDAANHTAAAAPDDNYSVAEESYEDEYADEQQQMEEKTEA